MAYKIAGRVLLHCRIKRITISLMMKAFKALLQGCRPGLLINPMFLVHRTVTDADNHILTVTLDPWTQGWAHVCSWEGGCGKGCLLNLDHAYCLLIFCHMLVITCACTETDVEMSSSIITFHLIVCKQGLTQPGAH